MEISRNLLINGTHLFIMDIGLLYILIVGEKMEKLTELLFLRELSGVGPARINKFYLPELRQGMDFDGLIKYASENEKKATPGDIDSASEKAKRICQKLVNGNGINIVTIMDKNYPSKLKSLGNKCPVILFYRGDLSIIEEKSIAIVGTREPSEWSSKVEKQLTDKIIELSDRIIVSGLALGCDTIAHKTCIESGGKTVAVLPCGINNISPEENRGLCDEIVKTGGLLISEYFPEEPATQYTFVERDTLIAAFSDATFVVECGVKSGTMHTADAAEKLGRRMAAYYTEIIGKGNYEGNKHIIDNKGASKVVDTESLKMFLDLITEDGNGSDEPVQMSIFDLMG